MKKIAPAVLTVGLSLMAVALCGCASRTASKPAPLRTVSYVDLPRFMGDWRVIANIPYFAEKDCLDSIESYALRPDGVIENWFTFRKKSFDAPQKTFRGQAVVVNKQTNAQWKVRFLGGLISADYLIIDLDPAYQWTVVAHPSRKYGWVMARARTLHESTYQGILKRLEAQGYDIEKFQKVPQNP